MKTRIKILIIIAAVIGIFLISLASLFAYISGPSSREHKKPCNPKLGAIILPTTDIPVGDFSEWPGNFFTKVWDIVKMFRSWNEGYKIANQNGFTVVNHFQDWGEIEKSTGNCDWFGLDMIIKGAKRNHLETSLIIKVINTYELGKYPDDLEFKSFDDPVFIEQFKDFIHKLVDRYEGKIDYIWIGNEISDYFSKNPEQVDSFLILYDELEKEIKSIDPEIIVGIDIEYFIIHDNNHTDLIKKFAEKGDAIAVSVYPDSLNLSVSEIGGYFDELFNLTGDQKVAIVETSWATKEPFGNESMQEEYVREIFKMMKKHKDQLLFFSWSFLQDISEKSIERLAKEVYPEILEEHQELFLDWIGSLGLIHNNGTGKLGWHAWQEEVSKLLGEQTP